MWVMVVVVSGRVQVVAVEGGRVVHGRRVEEAVLARDRGLVAE